jgi:hypothetical protein
MNREDWIRCLQHIPWGLLAVGLFLYHPLLGAAACFMELGYEAFNDWRKADNSYKDVLGIVWGILLGGYILLALKLVNLI